MNPQTRSTQMNIPNTTGEVTSPQNQALHPTMSNPKTAKSKIIPWRLGTEERRLSNVVDPRCTDGEGSFKSGASIEGSGERFVVPGITIAAITSSLVLMNSLSERR